MLEAIVNSLLELQSLLTGYTLNFQSRVTSKEVTLKYINRSVTVLLPVGFSAEAGAKNNKDMGAKVSQCPPSFHHG